MWRVANGLDNAALGCHLLFESNINPSKDNIAMTSYLKLFFLDQVQQQDEVKGQL